MLTQFSQLCEVGVIITDEEAKFIKMVKFPEPAEVGEWRPGFLPHSGFQVPALTHQAALPGDVSWALLSLLFDLEVQF